MTLKKRTVGQTAIVIGGSMAGLLAAQALAGSYAEVMIIERDALPESSLARKGVPQGRHAHALLARGQQVLEELFPGLTQQLVDLGAARGHGRFYSGGGYHARTVNGPGGLFVSRPCLELAVRTRLLALPNVRIIERTAARGLVASEDRGQVIGVSVNRQETSREEILSADLVADATGRGSQAPAWLEALGYAGPEVELVKVGMGYSSRYYRREPGHVNGDPMVNVAPTPENRRACGMMAQEGDRWIVTLAGYFGDYPPTTEQGFLDFAGSLPVPDVYEVIRSATPLNELQSYRFPANQRRHYEKLKRFPEGFLVIGDAIASFTPIYGQGMTVAALEALALRDSLEHGTSRLARRYFKRAAAVVDIAWNITVGNDLQLSESATEPSPSKRFLGWYLGKLQVAARQDAELAAAFQRVGNLIDAPPSLLKPRIALRVLYGYLARSIRSGEPSATPVAPAAPTGEAPLQE